MLERWTRVFAPVQQLTSMYQTVRKASISLIAFGKPSATLDEIEQAARAANAHDFIMQ